ncbi:hypothetical protein JL108_02130 [Aeromicrobium sp. YIM 150415]|uniref:hypothetical protein n=1 Tax=Aeromicrobium sp. YIM 150415 TaxID=2803912 RepID=UPI00196244B9|nr:hypothetical protein [Aeromicrobium sp. YIM 150415]MBM9462227.1 hypothetical protein [Aeromicrobium sp. YIM 150415]
MSLLRPLPSTVHSQIDLLRLWRRLLRGRRESAVCLKCLFIARDGRTVRTLLTLTDVTGPLSPERSMRFADWLLDLLDHEPAWWRIGFLLCRPDVGPVRTDDLEWAATVRSATVGAGAGCEVIHLCAAGAIAPLPLDDLPTHAFGP